MSTMDVLTGMMIGGSSVHHSSHTNDNSILAEQMKKRNEIEKEKVEISKVANEIALFSRYSDPEILIKLETIPPTKVFRDEVIIRGGSGNLKVSTVIGEEYTGPNPAYEKVYGEAQRRGLK